MNDKSADEITVERVKTIICATRPALYLIIVLIAVLAANGHQLGESIFGCAADGYASDRYLAYCQTDSYGDYDHGAFWFGLEPTAQNFARHADVLFIGNSRMQMGFSTGAISNWFSSNSAKYYLLGFAYHEKYRFEQGLLRKLQPQAKVYVVNIDSFFEPFVSAPAQLVMHDDGALPHYQTKRLWQLVHRPICTAAPVICGHQFAFFRSRPTGAFISVGGTFNAALVSDDSAIDEETLERQPSLGHDFVFGLPVRKSCVILTLVPTVKTQRALASAVAAALNMDLFAPTVDGLRTYDGSHLDRESAERWSTAFLKAASSRIQECLEKPRSSHTS